MTTHQAALDAVAEYLEDHMATLEAVQVDGQWAVRATIPYPTALGSKPPIVSYFVVGGDIGDGTPDVEEAEFATWPPQPKMRLI